MNLKPIKDNVVIEKVEAENVTKSGIVIPDNVKDKPAIGKVVAIGPGRVLENGSIIVPEVKVGDKVYYSKYSGSEIKLDEKSYIIISESNILTIIE
jgi:chaperonin GroES